MINLGVGGVSNDGCFGALRRCQLGGVSRFGECHNALQIDRFIDRVQGFTDGIRILILVGWIVHKLNRGFHLRGNPRQHFDRLDRVAAHRRLTGQHHRIRTIHNRIRHITGLRPRGAWIMDHAVQHLGCRNHRNSPLITEANDLFLNQGHFLRAHFHSQVPPRHHHRITFINNGLQIGDRLRFFQLGQHRNFRTLSRQQCLQHLHIFRLAHKAQRNQINPLGNPKFQIPFIFVGNGR